MTARFSRDGSFFLTGGCDPVVRLWDTRDVNLSGTFREHKAKVHDVCVTGDGLKFSSCGRDGQVLYWDISTQSVIRKYGGYDSMVNSVKFNDFDSVVVSVGSSYRVRVWDLRSHNTKPVQTFPQGPFHQEGAISFGLRRSEIILGCVSGNVLNFDLRNERKLAYNLGAPVTRISMSNKSGGVLANCRDHTLRLLHVDTSTIETVGEYKGPTSEMWACCFANSDAHVVGGSADGNIIIWDMLTKAVVCKFPAHLSEVTSVSVHPKDNCLLTAALDGSVALWKEAM